MKLRVAKKVMTGDWSSRRKTTVARARRRLLRWRNRNRRWEMLIYGWGINMGMGIKKFRSMQ